MLCSSVVSIYDRVMLNERLKNLRLAKGMTLQQVGDAFGISRSSVSSWESGTNQPDPRKLEKLADLYGTSVNFIVTGQNQGPIEQLTKDPANKLVPFITWSNLTISLTPEEPVFWVQCLYVTPSDSAFATRYIPSDSIDWQPSLVPAGAIIVVDPKVELTPGKLVLANIDGSPFEIAQTFKVEPKAQVSLEFVNSKLTTKLNNGVKVLGTIQEWRIGGKL